MFVDGQGHDDKHASSSFEKPMPPPALDAAHAEQF